MVHAVASESRLVSRVSRRVMSFGLIMSREGSQEDTFRIMLATDNHIGYLERDPIRGRDSIDTFEEILKLAVKHDVSYAFILAQLIHIWMFVLGRLHTSSW